MSPQSQCGIPRIDALYSAAFAPPIRPGDDPAAIGALQDLLSGQGFQGLPGMTSPSYGTFGPATTAALSDFRQAHNLAQQEGVERDTLTKLVSEPASDPRVSQVYLTLVLGISFTPLHKLICLTAQMEGIGRFGALNLNTDGAGLSFGILQWAQRPGGLAELLTELHDADSASFVDLLGAGDPGLAAQLLNHVQKANGGVDANGHTTNPAFDLLAEPWISRFRQAGLSQSVQRVQVKTAAAAFRRSHDLIAQTAPNVTTERGIAFLLDVANQFGPGGMRQLCRSVARDGMSESDLLAAVAAESVKRMPDKFKTGVQTRRDAFLRMPLLSDGPFQEAQTVPA